MKKLGVIFAAVVVIGLLIFTMGDSNEMSGGNNVEDNFGNTAAQQEFLSGAVKKDIVDATNQRSIDIEINDFFFNPTILTIKKGSTVTWTNKGSIRHDVMPASASPNNFTGSEELLGNGESYSYTFEEAGQYFYFCSPHPTQMRGVIIVE